MTTAVIAVAVMAAAVGGLVVLKRRVPDGAVSERWLAEHARKGRDEFDGPVWAWPIDKRLTENGWWNRYTETERRKSA